MIYEPHDYQKYAINFIKENPIAAVLLDMGDALELVMVKELADGAMGIGAEPAIAGGIAAGIAAGGEAAKGQRSAGGVVSAQALDQLPGGGNALGRGQGDFIAALKHVHKAGIILHGKQTFLFARMGVFCCFHYSKPPGTAQ